MIPRCQRYSSEGSKAPFPLGAYILVGGERQTACQMTARTHIHTFHDPKHRATSFQEKRVTPIIPVATERRTLLFPPAPYSMTFSSVVIKKEEEEKDLPNKG